MKIPQILFAAGVLSFGTLVGCLAPTGVDIKAATTTTTTAATNTATATPTPAATATPTPTATPTATAAPTVTPEVYQVSGTSSAWAKSDITIYPISGETITGATVTYAVDLNALATIFAGWQYAATDGASWTWAGNATTKPTSAQTWVTSNFTESGVTPLSAAGSVIFEFGHNSTATAGTVYIKQITLAYGDGTSETLTFTSSTTTPVSGLVGSTTTSYALGKRLIETDGNYASTPTEGLTTVAF